MALTLITFMSFGHLKLFHVNLRDHQMICNFEICRYLFKDNCIKLPYTMYKKGHHHKLHIFQSYSTLCLWWTQMLSGIEPVALMGKNWSSPKASTALQQQGEGVLLYLHGKILAISFSRHKNWFRNWYACKMNTFWHFILHHNRE